MKTRPKAKTSARKRRPKTISKTKRAKRPKAITKPSGEFGGSDRLLRLANAVYEVSTGDLESPRTTRLIAQGIPKMAQKVIEEAGEAAIEAVRNDVPALIRESADLLYNLVVLWTASGVSPDDVWEEMDRREAVLGMAEKLPKPPGYDDPL